MMKDFIFCLPIMEKNINVFAAAEFCGLNMYQVLKAWIDETQYRVFPRILSIFSEQEIVTFSPVLYTLHSASNNDRNPKDILKRPWNPCLAAPYPRPVFLAFLW